MFFPHDQIVTQYFIKLSTVILKNIRGRGDRVTIHGQDAGLHILLELNSTKDNQHMVDLAAQHGVMVAPTQQFWYNRKNAINNMQNDHLFYELLTPPILALYFYLKTPEMLTAQSTIHCGSLQRAVSGCQ